MAKIAKKHGPKKGPVEKKRKATGKVKPKKAGKALPVRKVAAQKPQAKRSAAERAAIEKKLGPRVYASADLDAFRKLILEKRTEELEALDTLKESMMDVTTGEYVSESSTYSLHMEQGTDAMEREKTFLFASRSSKYLNQLDDALMRVDNKSFGQCKVCGLLIPKERLQAVPTATTCIEYKTTNHPCERGRLALSLRKEDEEEGE